MAPISVIILICLWSGLGLTQTVTDVMLAPTETPKTIGFREALSMALEKNSGLKKVAQGAVMAKSEAHIATSKLLPKVTANARQTVINKANDRDESAHATLSLSVPLLDAKALMEMRSKRETLGSAKDKYQFEEDALINTVGNLYIEALIAQAIKDNAFEERDQYQKQLLMFEKKAAVQSARALDVTRARYLANKAHSDYLLKEQEFQKRLGELGQKIGMRELFLLSMVEIDSVYLAKNKEELQELALNAADISMAKRDVLAADYALVSEKFDFLPRVFASMDSGYQAPYNNTTLGRDWTFSTKLMINLELPLFSGGAGLAALKNKTAHKTVNELTLRQKTSEKILNINGLLLQINDLAVVKQSEELALLAATEAKASADRLFALNEITGLEFAEASTNLFSAKNNLAMTTLRLLQVKLRLLFVIGKAKEVL